ncbi:class I SAM-dependent methyltransferase [Alphaproteobacteria bacterium]|nr:class I SAM-dependent methyltransferase [Alphaproteobacteria bacterium]
MNKYKKYSKSVLPYIKHKSHLLGGNPESIEKAEKINKSYTSGPRRLNCKMCGVSIDETEVSFRSHGVGYLFCTRCCHLNGEALETHKFVSELYAEDSGTNYSSQYLKEDWLHRVDWVYRPKMNFLLEALTNVENILVDDISILDVGCGSGGFSFVANDLGLDVVGVDVNQELVKIGNQITEELVGKRFLNQIDIERFYDEIAQSKQKVVCALGVIEHLLEPDLFFEAFKQSQSEYLYYLVPMFSFSTILEVAFPEKFPRVLSGGHTHLFTEESIAGLHKNWDLKSIGEWRIGLDAADLVGVVNQSLTKNEESKSLSKVFEKKILGFVDDLQQVFDKNHFCSELHCVVKK